MTTGVAAKPGERGRWFLRYPRTAPGTMQLFCFPYAGGAASLYRTWPTLLPAWIEVNAVQLPGRGSRLREPPFRDLETVADLLTQEVLRIADGPFAFYGHSMGALLAFEVARRTEATGRPVAQLFLAAHPAPHVLRRPEPMSDLPDTEFLNRLRAMAGTPEDILRSHELMRLLLPALRADFRLCESYVFRTAPPLGAPIVAIGGSEDQLATPDEMKAWELHTAAQTTVRILPGGHFFLNTATEAVTDIVSAELAARRPC